MKQISQFTFVKGQPLPSMYPRLIEHLLAYSGIESGKYVINLELTLPSKEKAILETQFELKADDE